ncbi:ABC transporter ATP-binding protein [Adlercreutzia murintestinalis]|uniref:ABC transporter ATP-binding protein n=1 Tax=Adlercreutzia murintestinalis TaxID=2941325 RepID=UPI002557DFBE|nr:ABC transporter ATP-binding protein [Adlercreutzia murintestinalis]
MAETVAQPQGMHAASATALAVRQLRKSYGTRDSITNALDGVSFDVESGEFVGIMGPSGSGKTTLLNCVSTIDKATSGQIVVGGQNIMGMRRAALAKFRREQLGFIFQDFNLLETLTAFENIALSLTIKHVSPAKISQRVEQVAASLGVTQVLQKYPHQMSGGQKQRVAAARAIVGDPKLILADEPTGALDSRSATVLLETLEMMNERMGATIMMVTHDSFAASFASRVLFIKDGKLFNEIRRGNATRSEFFQRIVEVVSFLSGEAMEAVETVEAVGVENRSATA